MLFAVKNHLWPTLLLWMGLTIASLLARAALDLEWELEPGAGFWWQVLLGLTIVAASDGLLHGVLWFLRGKGYTRRYTDLVDYFSGQRVPEILASGLLAGSEEMFFRGLILQGCISILSLSPVSAVAVSALLFGLCHLIPRRSLWPFALWATWEGVLLGLVYVLSGSLLVSMAVHAVHDSVGFALFAFQRQHGWLLHRQKVKGDG